MLMPLKPGSESIEIDTVITSLLSQLKRDFPQAGSVYWANRCWALVYWQPIYLAVYAVHKHNSWFSFNEFQLELDKQRVSDDFIVETGWLQKSGKDTNTSTLVQQQALALKPLLECYLASLKRHTLINSINAWRLIADCILIAMLEIEIINDQQKLDYSSIWLKAFGLFDRKGKPHSQFKQNLSQDCSYLALDRKSCCMHYLIEPNNPCITCNKFSANKKDIRNKDKQ